MDGQRSTWRILCLFYKRLTAVEVELGDLQGVGLTLLLAEAEDDHGLEVPLHNHLHDLEDAGRTWRGTEMIRN